MNMNIEGYEFRIADFEYLTEGGSSILLQPSSSSSSSSSSSPPSFSFSRMTPNIVLKVPKQNFSSTLSYKYQQVISCHNSFVDAWFDCRYIIRPLHSIPLSKEDLEILYENIDSFRPHKRREIILQDVNHYPSYGRIERNITLSDGLVALSFELKVKCGLKSYSPFVSIKDTSGIKGIRKMKHSISRYALMQLVKLCEFSTYEKGSKYCQWGDFETMSDYDPSALCSRDISKVKNALGNLLSNPQNNLRICLNGKHIYGWGIAHIDNFTEFLSTLPLSNVLPSPVDYLAKVLVDEDVLQRLESLQALDAFIDIEGCQAIFGRLMELCAENEDVAIQKIVEGKAFLELLHQDLALIHTWVNEIESGTFDRCTYQMGTIPISDFLWKMLQLTPSCSKKDSININEKISTSLDIWLKTLDEDDCILYLQFWLLALSAKDASLIVTLSLSSSYTWSHTIHLIDIGPKPVSKIFQKVQMEAEIIEKASVALAKYSKKDISRVCQECGHRL